MSDRGTTRNPTPMLAPKTQTPRSARRRTVAASTLFGLVLTVAATALLAVDPARLGRWAARIQVAVDGGSYQGREGVVLQRTLSDCGPAALANMIQVLGLGTPATDSLGVLAGTGPAGTRASGLVRAAEVFGLSLTLNRLRHGGIAEIPKPFIAWVHRSHFVTVTEWTPDGGVTVLDPQVGRYTIGEADFNQIWSGEAVVLRESPDRSRRRASRTNPRSINRRKPMERRAPLAGRPRPGLGPRGRRNRRHRRTRVRVTTLHEGR